MAEDFDSICPFCNYHHDAVSAARSDTDFPDDGDATLCISCGRFCVFDRDARGGLRKPTKKEQRSLDRDEDLVKLTNAWKTLRQ